MKKRFVVFLLAILPMCMLVKGQSVSTGSVVNKVGIATSSPSEILDVSGTVRVQTLPFDGSTSGIYTMPDGQASTSANQPFNAEYFVVANSSGVLGKAKGLQPEYFYMPSIVLPLSPLDVSGTHVRYTQESEVFTIDLHKKYMEQFSLGVNSARNPSSVASGLSFWGSASNLHYFVTYFDKAVYDEVKITDQGILTYKVKSVAARSPKTFMNIVLKVR